MGCKNIPQACVTGKVDKKGIFITAFWAVSTILHTYLSCSVIKLPKMVTLVPKKDSKNKKLGYQVPSSKIHL